MNEEARQKKIKYNAERQKELLKNKIIKQYKTVLPYKEAVEIEEFIKKHNLTKKEIVLRGYKLIKTEYLDK